MTEAADAVAASDGFGPGMGFAQFAMAGSAWLQSIGDATRAMFADAGDAAGRLPQAAALLTDNGDLGSVGVVLAPLVGMLAVSLIDALGVARALAPRAPLVEDPPATALRFVAVALRALLVDLAPPLVYLGVAMLLERLLFAGSAMMFP